MTYYLFFTENSNSFIGYTQSKEVAQGFLSQRKGINKLDMKKVKDEFFKKRAMDNLLKSHCEIFDYHGTYLLPDEEDSVHTECRTMYSQTYILLRQYSKLSKFIKFNDDDEDLVDTFNVMISKLQDIMESEFYTDEESLDKTFKIGKLALSVIKRMYKVEILGEG